MSDPQSTPTQPTPPHDIARDIPDRSAHRPAWKYVLVAVAFIVWMCILAALFLIGG